VTRSIALWKISDELENLEYAMSDLELSEEQRESAIVQFFEKEEVLEQKIENSCGYLQNLEFTEKAVKAKAKELQEKAKTLELKREKFKRYLILYMKKHEKFKLDFGAFKVTLSQTSGACDIPDESIIESKYLEEIITHRVMKKEILKELRNGKSVTGAKLKKSDKLTIK